MPNSLVCWKSAHASLAGARLIVPAHVTDRAASCGRRPRRRAGGARARYAGAGRTARGVASSGARHGAVSVTADATFTETVRRVHLTLYDRTRINSIGLFYYDAGLGAYA